MDAHVLVVDDEQLIRKSLGSALARVGYNVRTAGSLSEAGAVLRETRPDLVVLDLVLADGSGMDLLRSMRADAPETKVLVITAHGSIEDAVVAMKLGAYDFIKKPFELEEILAAVRNALHTSALEQRVEYLEERARKSDLDSAITAESPLMQAMLREASLIATNDVPVALVLGETGTGKQLLARFLHEQSQMSGGAFVELNSSAIPESLVESELFGHERGAFSDARARKPGLVEIADGGTLFLDEIGDLGASAQAKLLTFLEQRTFRRLGGTELRRVRTRVVAATNRDLPSLVREKRFREDLWFRLSGMCLRIPPLRERPEDLEPLVQRFLREANRAYDRRWTGVAADALAVMRRYRWPGNVRELRAVVQRAALMNDDELLRATHLPAELIDAALVQSEVEVDDRGASVRQTGGIPSLAEVEVLHIRRVLALCGGNKTQAAQHLGITRQTLAKKLGSEE